MLTRLSVENYALIEGLEMELSSGLNIITGETGAGKSILLGALGLALGNRADTSALKDNEHNCVIEAVFNIEGYGLEEFFEANDLDYEPSATVRRIISPQGKSRSYVNDIPVQLAVLKELSAELIDIHSQHQTLLLGAEHFRVSIIDSVTDNEVLRNRYSAVYKSLKHAEQKLSRMREECAAAKRDREYICHQLEQLQRLKLHPDEETELEAEQCQLSNAEAIAEAVGFTHEMLDADDTGVLSQLKTAESKLHHIAEFYPLGEELARRIRSTIEELKDIDASLNAIEADPLKLEIIDNRLSAIYELFRKHGVESTEELIALAKEFEHRLELMASSDEQIEALEREEEALRSEATALAGEITALRLAASDVLSGEVEAIIARLGMPASQFVCDISPLSELSPSGADAITFLFTANAGGTPQPLERIASGGETSRVMLALKSIVARRTRLATIIFDEIDTGVSGRIADATGEIIAELGNSMQVINITHLPQVASKGGTHFVVYKQDGKTLIKRLTDEERVEEIAKMLSGNRITDAAMIQARELLNS